MNINFAFILIFSFLWAFSLIRTSWKDYRKEKMNFKLRNTVPEYKWLNIMNNFRSNRIKNCIMLSICACESGITGVFVFNQLRIFLSTINEKIEDKVQYFIQSTAFFVYNGMEHSMPDRLTSISTLTIICLLAFLVRILTQSWYISTAILSLVSIWSLKFTFHSLVSSSYSLWQHFYSY